MGTKKKTRKAKQSKPAKATSLKKKIAAGSKSILRVFANLEYPDTRFDSSNSDDQAPASPPWIHFT
jgi:hypothetical protein